MVVVVTTMMGGGRDRVLVEVVRCGLSLSDGCSFRFGCGGSHD